MNPTFESVLSTIAVAVGGVLVTAITVFGGQLVALLKYHIFLGMTKKAAEATEQTAPKGASDEVRRQMSQTYLQAFAKSAGLQDMVPTIGMPLTEAHVLTLPDKPVVPPVVSPTASVPSMWIPGQTGTPLPTVIYNNIPGDTSQTSGEPKG